MHPIPYWLSIFLLSMFFVYFVGLVNSIVLIATAGEVGSYFVSLCIPAIYLLSEYVFYLCEKHGIDPESLSRL